MPAMLSRISIEYWCQQPSARPCNDLTIKPDSCPAYERSHNSPMQLSANVRAVPMPIAQVVGLKSCAVGQIDQREIGVGTYGYAALLRQPKALRDEFGSYTSNGFERQLALEVAVGQQQLQGRLAARDAAPDREEIET